jgi:hypothetical protein
MAFKGPGAVLGGGPKGLAFDFIWGKGEQTRAVSKLDPMAETAFNQNMMARANEMTPQLERLDRAASNNENAFDVINPDTFQNQVRRPSQMAFYNSNRGMREAETTAIGRQLHGNAHENIYSQNREISDMALGKNAVMEEDLYRQMRNAGENAKANRQLSATISLQNLIDAPTGMPQQDVRVSAGGSLQDILKGLTTAWSLFGGKKIGGGSSSEPMAQQSEDQDNSWLRQDEKWLSQNSASSPVSVFGSDSFDTGYDNSGYAAEIPMDDEGF